MLRYHVMTSTEAAQAVREVADPGSSSGAPANRATQGGGWTMRLAVAGLLLASCATVKPTDTRGSVMRRAATNTATGVPLLILGILGGVGTAASGAAVALNAGRYGEVPVESAVALGISAGIDLAFIIAGSVLLANGADLAEVSDIAERENVSPTDAFAILQREKAARWALTDALGNSRQGWGSPTQTSTAGQNRH